MALLREALVPPCSSTALLSPAPGGSFHVAQPHMGATANSLDNR